MKPVSQLKRFLRIREVDVKNQEKGKSHDLRGLECSVQLTASCCDEWEGEMYYATSEMRDVLPPALLVTRPCRI